MLNNKKVSAIILLGGVGNRFKNDRPKQFHKILNKKIYLYSLEVFYNSTLCDEIILVTHPDYIKEVEKDISSYPSIVKIITGGKFRQTSVLNGLKACSFKDIVIIHDSARPFITNDIIIKNIESAIQYKAADTCIKSSDTLVCINDKDEIIKIPDRSKILRGQTPQTFEYNLIFSSHEKALSDGITNATDDCFLITRLNKNVHVVMQDFSNIKITEPLDLKLAETILKELKIKK